MKHYIEIKLLYDGEIGLGFLWKKVFTQVHLALAQNGNSKIGISFPQYGAKSFPMGESMRIFGATREELTSLQLEEWMKRLKDYIEMSPILTTPDDVTEYVRFSRRQVKTGRERQARRYAKRHDIAYETALEYYENMEDKILKLPFISLSSLSSDQEMKLFIERSLSDKQINGEFNAYGLSKDATTPWF